MNKKDFIKEVSKESGVSKDDCKKVIDSMGEVIRNTLFMGIDIKISNFMNFVLTTSPPRKIKDPRNGNVLDIPKRYKVKVVLPKYFVDKMKTKTVY